MTKPMNAAEYRRHAQGVKDERPTEIVTLKSGAVFELRRPDLVGYVATGRLPQSLLRTGMQAWKEGQGVDVEAAAEIAASKMSDEEYVDSFVFMREIVHDCTVNPKFVEFATKDNEIGASEMLPEDFTEIYSWAMSHGGVAGLTGLQSFRGGQKRRTPVTKSRRKKLRRETIGATEG